MQYFHWYICCYVNRTLSPKYFRVGHSGRVRLEGALRDQGNLELLFYFPKFLIKKDGTTCTP